MKKQPIKQSNSQPLIVVTTKLPELVEKRLKRLFDAKLNPTDKNMTYEELIDAIKKANVLVPTVTDRIDSGIISQAGDNLKLIANFGAGVDHIDITTAHNRGITITNTPDVLTEDTADMTMALILSLLRRIPEGEKLVRSSNWQGWSPTTMLGHSISGKKLGIIGMGRIGTAVAKRAKGFGINVNYHNRRKISRKTEEALRATYWESLDHMLANMDIVSINCPHTPATFHLLSARRLKLLPKHCYIVNTSRGEIIDQSALTRMLEAGELAGAGLDVYEYEPAINPDLLKLDRVILLPHMSSSTIEGRIAMGEKVAQNIQAFLSGHVPPDKVTETML